MHLFNLDDQCISVLCISWLPCPSAQCSVHTCCLGVCGGSTWHTPTARPCDAVPARRLLQLTTVRSPAWWRALVTNTLSQGASTSRCGQLLNKLLLGDKCRRFLTIGREVVRMPKAPFLLHALENRHWKQGEHVCTGSVAAAVALLLGPQGQAGTSSSWVCRAR